MELMKLPETVKLGSVCEPRVWRGVQPALLLLHKLHNNLPKSQLTSSAHTPPLARPWLPLPRPGQLLLLPRPLHHHRALLGPQVDHHLPPPPAPPGASCPRCPAAPPRPHAMAGGRGPSPPTPVTGGRRVMGGLGGPGTRGSTPRASSALPRGRRRGGSRGSRASCRRIWPGTTAQTGGLAFTMV